MGGQHNAERDRERTRLIEGQGYAVLRFWNNEMLSNPESVYRMIDENLRGREPHGGRMP